MIGTTVMGAFLKSCGSIIASSMHTYPMTAYYDTRVFKGITLQTCAVHLVMPHATMQCPRVFKMATLESLLTD